MPREKEPLERKKKGSININIADIFRNPEIQKDVIKNCKRLKRNYGKED